MRRRHRILSAAVALALTGCGHTERISKDALIEKTRHWKEPKAAIWYYIGSRDRFDYFQYYDLGISERYTVESGQIALPRSFPLTEEREKWIVMRWGPAAILDHPTSNQSLEPTAGRREVHI